MSDLRTAAQQALEALLEVDNCTYINDYGDAALDTAYEHEKTDAAITALRAALAEPDHIPDAGKMVAEPCEMGAMCLNCQPRGPNGECPDAPQPEREPVEATPYNLKRIAWELERTALGDGFYGNALRVAKDMLGITMEDRSVLDRYATGTQTGTDHVHLQWLAQRLYNKDERAPEAPQLKAEQPAEQQPQEPVAWGIFYFGGKRNGRLYSQIDTEEGAKRYISDLHRSNDTDTFRAAPLYTAPKPRRNVTYVCPVCAASLERQE